MNPLVRYARGLFLDCFGGPEIVDFLGVRREHPAEVLSGHLQTLGSLGPAQRILIDTPLAR